MLDYYFIFRVVKKISTPFKEWDAFKSGVIDADGKLLVKALQRTPAQNRTFDKIDLLCLKLRTLLAKLNIPANPTLTIAAALWLLKEANDGDLESLLREEINDHRALEVYISEMSRITEEMAGGDAGGGTPSTNTSAMQGYPDANLGPTLGKMKRKGKCPK